MAEFRHGGEAKARPQLYSSDGQPLEVSDEAWADFIYMRANTAGVQSEWWYHHAGCGLWFLAERDTKTNEVRCSYCWSAA